MNQTLVENVDDDIVEAALQYLDDLRESGVVNMFASRPYVQEWHEDTYGTKLDNKTANGLVSYWMRTFGERHDIKKG